MDGALDSNVEGILRDHNWSGLPDRRGWIGKSRLARELVKVAHSRGVSVAAGQRRYLSEPHGSGASTSGIEPFSQLGETAINADIGVREKASAGPSPHRAAHEAAHWSALPFRDGLGRLSERDRARVRCADHRASKRPYA